MEYENKKIFDKFECIERQKCDMYESLEKLTVKKSLIFFKALKRALIFVRLYASVHLQYPNALSLYFLCSEVRFSAL